MVSVVKNDRVFCNSFVLELLDSCSYLRIHLGHLVVVLSPILAHFGMIGVVGGHAYLSGVVDFDVWAFPDLAFVAGGNIENGEEGTVFGPVFPMTFSSTFMPNFTLLA